MNVKTGLHRTDATRKEGKGGRMMQKSNAGAKIMMKQNKNKEEATLKFELVHFTRRNSTGRPQIYDFLKF
jgi:hypothetical protein